MIHLIIGAVILVGTVYFIVSMIVLAFRLMWLCCLIVAWCVTAAVTGVLAMAVGVQTLYQAIADWRWRRRYGEVLPPLPPE
jgi:hypothetical protein